MGVRAWCKEQPRPKAKAMASQFGRFLCFRIIELAIFFVLVLLASLLQELTAGESYEVWWQACLGASMVAGMAVVYVYVLFAYPLISLLSFTILLALRRGRLFGLSDWWVVNGLVPLLYGALLLWAIFAEHPRYSILLSLLCLVAVNVWISRKVLGDTSGPKK